MSEKLEFDLTVKNNQLSKALDEGSKKAGELGGVLSTALGVFGGNLATKAFDGVISGFTSLIDFSKEAITAAADQEVATESLNNALKRNGIFTKEASQSLQDYSTQMQNNTTFQDDAIQSNIALLASLTNLDTEGLKRATSAAADFAVVLGVDLETATRLISKAADGNVSALKRYGVTVEEGGSKSETLEKVLTKLNEKFGGAAAAQLNTYSGSLKAMKNAYGDMLEPIGGIIVKNPLVVATFNILKTSLNDANSSLSQAASSIKDFVNDGVFFLISSSQVLFDALDGVTRVLKGLYNLIGVGASIFNFGLIEPIKLAIDGVLKLGSYLPLIGDAIASLKNPLQGTSDAIKNDLDVALKALKASADDNIFTALSNGADAFANKMIETSEKLQIADNEANQSSKGRGTTEAETNADILEKRRQLGIDLAAISAQFAVEEEANKANLDTLKEESDLERRLRQVDNEFTHQAKLLEVTTQAELEKSKSIKNEKEKSLTQQKIIADAQLKAVKLQNGKLLEEEKIKSEAQKQIMGETLSQIATLQTSGNKTLVAIGKAAALAQLAISGPVAFGKAMELGPFIGPPLAAAVAVSFAAQAAKVAGVAFESGGIVGQSGASVGADNRIASIKDGELILNANQQKKLFDAINSGNLGGGDIIVQIDGREVARAVRNQIQGGFVLA